MNNLYLQDRLVALKQQEVQREVEQARLLREAQLLNADVLTRAAESLRNLLVASLERFQGQRSLGPQSY